MDISRGRVRRFACRLPGVRIGPVDHVHANGGNVESDSVEKEVELPQSSAEDVADASEAGWTHTCHLPQVVGKIVFGRGSNLLLPIRKLAFGVFELHEVV